MTTKVLHVASSLDSISLDQFVTTENATGYDAQNTICSLDGLRPRRRRHPAAAAMTVMDGVYDDDPNALVKRIRRLDDERAANRRKQIDVCSRRGIPLLSANRRHRFDVAALLQLSRNVRRMKPDVIRTWDESSYRWSRLCTARLSLPIERPECVNSMSNAVHTITASLGGEQVQSDFHSLDRRTIEPTRKQFLGSLNLPEGVRLIGAVGPLTTNARIKDLIWAAELLRVVNDETYLLIAGEGPEEWRLHRFRDQVGIRHRVRFLGKRIDYRQWLPLLDFFWSGSKTGNSPLYVLEAMSVGLPVVATDIAAHRELITAAENGFLVRPGDRAAFARYTWRMMNDNVECRRIGNAAIQSVAKRFVPIVAAGQSSDQVPL